MKVLVCGKGGCGKSTIVALLSKEMAKRKRKVLVIDNDESNIGLHCRLGMNKPEDFMNYFGGKKILFEKTKEITGKWALDDLPKEYLFNCSPWAKFTNLGKGAPARLTSLPREY